MDTTEAEFRILKHAPGVLFEDDEIAVRSYRGENHGITFSTGGSLFFAITAGEVFVNDTLLSKGMYGCLPRNGHFEADHCRCMLVDAKRFNGIFCLGGPIEDTGRLRYINGCTDTGLIQPLKLGDACLNALFFPAGTSQTPHRHPSHRIGTIYDGHGMCHTESGATLMSKGDIFIIPAQSLHWFTTTNAAMRIMVFHPDSEFGPTDEHHQMLDATLI
jgi:quercetin dioxygenase-like cupin family protein